MSQVRREGAGKGVRWKIGADLADGNPCSRLRGGRARIERLGSTAFLFEKMEASRDELRGEINVVRDELRGEINVVRDELRGEIGAVRDQIQTNASALVRIEAILEERLPRR